MYIYYLGFLCRILSRETYLFILKTEGSLANVEEYLLISMGFIFVAVIGKIYEEW